MTTESGDENLPTSRRGRNTIFFLPPTALRAEKIGNNRRKRGVHRDIKKIYGAPPSSLEEHHELIEDIKTIVQVMQTQGYKLEGLAQANTVLTSSKSAVMAQLVHMTVTPCMRN